MGNYNSDGPVKSVFGLLKRPNLCTTRILATNSTLCIGEKQGKVGQIEKLNFTLQSSKPFFSKPGKFKISRKNFSILYPIFVDVHVCYNVISHYKQIDIPTIYFFFQYKYIVAAAVSIYINAISYKSIKDFWQIGFDRI